MLGHPFPTRSGSLPGIPLVPTETAGFRAFREVVVFDSLAALGLDTIRDVAMAWINGQRVTGAITWVDGNTVTLEKAEGRHAGGTYSLSGKLLLENLRIPQLDATGTGTRGDRSFTLKASGPAANAALVIRDVPEPAIENK